MENNVYTALFASDLAGDVRAEFFDSVKFGFPTADATQAVLSKYRDLLNDPLEGPVVIVCLAALQMEAGELHAQMRDAALSLIDDRDTLRAWSGGDSIRKQELKKLFAAFEVDLLA